MLTEDYVSFETAKLLKEKGFESDDCHTAYDENGEFFLHGDYSKDRYGIVDAPTLQMAIKWLGKEHRTFLNVSCIPEHFCFTCRIISSSGETIFVTYVNTYEQAYEAAIKYCLENLI